jgi:tetratricopeptide (TPR) repeat protein
VLVVACALSIGVTAPLGAQPLASPTPASRPIADPVEYNAFLSAMKLTDPAKQAAALEAFVERYPSSVARVDALQVAMADYDRLGDRQRVDAMATRILQFDPDNVRALAIAIVFLRARVGADPSRSDELLAGAKRGLVDLATWQRPDDISEANFASVSRQMRLIFEGAIGFAMLEQKNYVAARQAYLEALQIDPLNVEDVYQLGVTDVVMQPIDVDGFWYLAKAAALTQPHDAAGAQKIEAFARARFRAYHGTDDDWTQLVAATASGTAPPPSFARSIRAASPRP